MFDGFRWTARTVPAAAGAVLLLLAVAAFRLFLLVCPTKMWTILRWSLEPDTDWTRPYQVALVAENAVENGGVVGTRVGQALFDRTVAPAAEEPWPGGAPSYDRVHPAIPWLATQDLAWSTQAFSQGMVLVKVRVAARVILPEVGPGGCLIPGPTWTTVERDYVVAPTAAGWRIVHVYVSYSQENSALLPRISPSAALFGQCGDG